MSNIPDDLKSDHLFLLIGQNPLPNFVAAMSLTCQGATVHLLHSDGRNGPATTLLAQSLGEVLQARRPDVKVDPRGISDSEAGAIYDQVKRLANGLDGQIGLNYTGGTKAMAVHSHRALSEQLSPRAFSYLDARQLAMRFDHGVPYPVAHNIELSLTELATLHGYTVQKITRVCRSLLLARALGKVYQSSAAADQWEAWLRIQKQLDREQEGAGFQVLPNPSEYPALTPFCWTMVEICGGTATPDRLAEVLACGKKGFRSCCKWLEGEWLEELAFGAVEASLNELQINTQDGYGMSVELIPQKHLNLRAPNFELDVAAILGYQLFAVSCIASRNKGGNTKSHLLEALIRARQFGGDEARVALLCCVDSAGVAALQDEIDREWHNSTQVRIFGSDDLLDLPTRFLEWFDECMIQ